MLMHHMLLKKIKIKVFKPMLVTGLILSSIGGVINISSSLTWNEPIIANAATINSITSKYGWVGNSYIGTKFDCSTSTSGYSCSNNINPAIHDIYVRPDGQIDLVQRSDEGYQFGSIYTPDGVKKQTYYSYADEDGGESITGNSQYTYMAKRVPAYGASDAAQYPAGALPIKNTDPAVYGANGWFGVERFLNNSNSPAFAPFNGGLNMKGSFLKLYDDNNPTFMRNLSNPYPQIAGMYATDTTLFISDYLANKVLKYDANTMVKTGEFAVNKPGKITMDKDGYLWIIGETNFRREKFYTKDNLTPTKIVKYDVNGNKQSQEIFDSALVAGDIAVDSQNRLVVGDSGVRSQVFYYSNLNSTPTVTKTVGDLNGLLSGVKGQYGDYKLFNIAGVGVDAQDNLVVGMNEYGMTKFNSAGVFQWFKHGTNWKGPGIIDPKNTNILYTSDYKYEIDWSKPPEQWKLLARTYDNQTFPNDYKNDQYHTGEFTTPLMNSIKACYINNQLFTIDSENTDTTIGFHKFVPGQYGELAVPAGYFYLGKPRSKINPAKNAWEEGWFWNSQWDPLPATEKTLRWWGDDNNNQTREAGETKMMTQADLTRLGGNDMRNNYTREFDDDCGLWTSDSYNISYLPASGLNSAGNPNYDFANARRFNVPAEFTHIDKKVTMERMWYDKSTDSMYITGYPTSKQKPDNTPEIYGWNGTTVMRYNNWMSGNPTKAWQQDIPFILNPNNPNDIMNSTSYSTFAQVGDLIFMSRNQEWTNNRPYGFVRVIRASDGVFLGDLEIPANDQSNRPDGPKSMRAIKNLDGTYTVSQIDVTRSKVRMWQVIPDNIVPVSSSSSSVVSSPAVSSASTSSVMSSSVVSSSTSSSVVSSISSSAVTSSSPSTAVREYKKVPDNFVNGGSLGGSVYNLANTSGAITGASDLSATATPAWNNNGMFFEFNVMDNTLSTNNSADSYNQDGVEIMLDTNNSKGSNYDGVNDCKFAFTYSGVGNNAFSNGQGSNCTLTGTNVLKTGIAGGYKINIYIPFSAIGGSGTDNQIVGWDAQVNDSDDNTTRKGAVTLNNPNLGNIWNIPSTWGTAKLLPLGANVSSSSAISSSAMTNSSVNSIISSAVNTQTPLNLKVNLQGSYNTSTNSMKTTLKTKNLIPLNQPYNNSTFNYTGTETTTASTMPSNTVDWILLEFKNSSGVITARKAALLKSDGTAVNSDGSNLTIPSTLTAGNYQLIIRHRNHLAIATNTALNITLGTPTTIDFTNNSNVKGSNQAMLSNGTYGLKQGNANGSNAINSQDRVAIRASSDQNNVYNSLDINMDGIISSIDRIISRTLNDGVENI